jgi:hypothetical protein
MSLLAAVVLACAGGEDRADPADSSPVDTRDSAGDTAPDTSDTGTPDPLRDLDGDGVSEDIDCDDRDPGRTPGRAEAWDGVDNDCDGRADADGRFVGGLPVVASAVYEGRTYTFRLVCPVTLVRERRRIELSLTCTPDSADASAQLLLGATLTLTAVDTYVAWGPSWSDTIPLVSSSGWDTDAEVRAAWTEAPGVGDPLDGVDVSVDVRAPFLTLSGAGMVRLGTE